MSDTQRTLTANFVADTSGFSPKVNELIQRLKTLNQDFETNKAKVKDLNNQIKFYQQELDKLNSSTNNGANASREQQQRMQQLRDSIAACNTQIGTYRAAQTNLRSQINSTNRELTEQQQAFNGVNTAAMSFGEILKANLASDLIQASLRKVLDLLRQAAAYCYEVGASFEASMSKVAAVSGASADELERLTAKARELGSNTKFTATQAAEAMNYMAMAGWKTQEILDGIDGVLRLAVASGTDLATTSDIVTDAMTAFGLKAKDCAHFADILAAASSNANTNVSMMGETFKYCAPVAGALGFSAEDVAVGVGLMANSGIKATNAGTAMRTVMTKLAKDVKITGDAIGEVTVRTSNADGSMRKFADITNELRVVFSQLTASEKSIAAESIAGKNAMSGFLALMNAGEADVQKLTSAIANCDGAASSMAETMQDNIQGAVTKFNSALEGVGIAVYDKFKDGLTDAVNIFTEAMSELTGDIENGRLDDSLESLADSFKSAATEIAGIVKDYLPGFIDGIAKGIDFVIEFRDEIAAVVRGVIAFKSVMAINNVVGAAISSLKKLTTAIKEAEGATAKFNTVMSKIPLSAVAVAASLLVTEVDKLIGRLDDCNDKAEQSLVLVDDLTKSSQKYQEKAKGLADISKRFEEITSSEDSAYEKTQELNALQETLISLCGSEAENIDLVTAAFSNQADVLEKLNGMRNDYNEKSAEDAKAALDELKKAEKYSTAVNTKGLSEADISGWASANLKTYNKSKSFGAAAARAGAGLVTTPISFVKGELGDQTFYLDGTFEERRADLEKLREYLIREKNLNSTSETVKTVDALLDDLNEQIAKRNDYSKVLNRLKDGREPEREIDWAGSWTWAEQNDYRDDGYNDVETEEQIKPPLSQEEREELYKQEKQLADDMYSVGEVSAEEYYKKLVELRDKYLDKGTHEWYQATAQIQSAYTKTADGIAEAAAKSASKVKNSLDEVQMAYKKTLAAIDTEIERRNREKSDAAFQNKINKIDSQLTYGRLDDFSKYELEKERQRLIDEHNDELYERSAADAKAIVKDVYEAKTTLDKADWGTREYTLAVGDYTDALGDLTEVMRGVGSALGVQQGGNSTVSNIDESTINQYNNIVLQAVNRSNSQLIDELIRALHSGL